MSFLRWSSLTLIVAICGLSGCYSSSAPPSAPSGGTPTADSPPAKDADEPAASATADDAAGDKASPTAAAPTAEYPDVPHIEIMTEVDGIPVPRIEQQAADLQLEGQIPVDVGNPRAKQPSEKATGDAIIVRMAAEPKSLNPITENSAVKSYIMEYVNDALARQDPETFEYLPHMAERWVTEDSVKLSPNYPGQERQVKLGEGKPQETLDIDYAAPEPGSNDEPAVVEVVTTDKDGEPLANVWVGVYPAEKILGAPTTGYHTWSDAEGKAKLGGYPTGKYIVKVGAEVYGKTVKEPDGSLVVTPATPENPLHEELQSTPNSTLTLKPGEWIDRHEQTYFTYYLRPDLTWSDGEPFTTQDLEFAYAVLNNPLVDGDSIRVYYQDLVECKAFSPQVVRMRYRQQYFKAFEFTAGMSIYAPPWHLYVQKFQDQGKELTLDRLTPEEEASQNKVSVHGKEFGQYFNQDQDYNLSPLGTGPYMVAQWENNDRVELVRNPNYWNPERAGYLDKLIFKFIIDDNAVLPALQTGLIDFAFSLTAEQYFETLGGPPDWVAEEFVKADWYTPAFSYVGWNELKPLFQDRKVRIALGLLFDKQRFLETKMHNAGMIVSGSAYYFGPGYDHSVKPLAYDPETARDLLAQAGWLDSDNDGVLDKNGQKFSFEALLPQGRKSTEDRMALLQSDLKSVGIEMNIRMFEWASFIEKIQQRDFDVVTLSWAMPIESDPYQIWHGQGAGKQNRGSNHISFDNSTANDLIEMLRITLDDQKRYAIAKNLHRLLDSEQPYMFLYCAKDLGAYHQRFRGVKWYRLRPGYDLLEWYVPKDEQLRK